MRAACTQQTTADAVRQAMKRTQQRMSSPQPITVPTGNAPHRAVGPMLRTVAAYDTRCYTWQAASEMPQAAVLQYACTM